VGIEVAGRNAHRGKPRVGCPTFRGLACCLIALGAALVACSGPGRSARARTPLVLVSVSPEAYLVRSIAGHRVSVEVLLPPGASPHTYEPSIGTARRAADADLYLTVGHPRLSFEASWVDVLRRAGHVRIVPLASTCDVRPDDPHVWLSAACADSMARRAEVALERILPASEAGALRASLDSTLTAMRRASAEADSLLTPFTGRSFLVFHPAWGYFATDHGLRQVAIQSGSREPGPRDLARVLRQVREEDLRVMFIQPGTPRDEAERIASRLGVRTKVLDPLAEDWTALVVDAAREIRDSWTP
jgi:zinc transport system substrate-binding protein